ncbi:hypothetical protein LLG96_05800 [bacterium]|nr:hypothetical protein [bacterium]
MLFIAVLSLCIISWDYTYRHTFEDVVNNVYCPICDSFLSLELGPLLLYILVLLGFIRIPCCFISIFYFFPHSQFSITISPNRAPPAAA